MGVGWGGVVGWDPGPSLRLSAPDLARDLDCSVARAVDLLRTVWRNDPTAVPLIFSTADPERVRAEQAEVGPDRAAALVERALADVARRAVLELGARRLIVAGGETSGAVTAALAIDTLQLTDVVEPGLAWAVGTGQRTPRVAVLLKSGNFGAPDLFTTAWETCP